MPVCWKTIKILIKRFILHLHKFHIIIIISWSINSRSLLFSGDYKKFKRYTWNLFWCILGPGVRWDGITGSNQVQPACVPNTSWRFCFQVNLSHVAVSFFNFSIPVWSSKIAYIWVPNIMPVKRPNSSEIKSKIVSNIRDTGGESDPQLLHSESLQVTIFCTAIYMAWTDMANI